MSKNIFEGAKFGDKFVIQGLPNEYVVLWQHIKLEPYQLDKFQKKNPNIKETEFICYVTQNGEIRCVNMNGQSFESEFYDIVSRYKEPIDEYELDELATNWWLDDSSISYAKDAYTKMYTGKTLMYAFKAGYRTAKEV